MRGVRGDADCGIHKGSANLRSEKSRQQEQADKNGGWWAAEIRTCVTSFGGQLYPTARFLVALNRFSTFSGDQVSAARQMKEIEMQRRDTKDPTLFLSRTGKERACNSKRQIRKCSWCESTSTDASNCLGMHQLQKTTALGGKRVLMQTGDLCTSFVRLVAKPSSSANTSSSSRVGRSGQRSRGRSSAFLVERSKVRLSRLFA